MRNFIPFFLLALFVFSFNNSFAQADTSFWFGAPTACPSHEVGYPVVIRFSSYSQPANIEISLPANPSFTPIKTSIGSFSSVTIDLTPYKSQIQSPLAPNPNNGYALKVTSTASISAYYELGKQFNPELFVLKGRNSLGTSFIIPGQNNFSNAQQNGFVYSPQPKNGFVVAATQNNTKITIVPSKNAVGHLAKQAFTITLNRGETYTLEAEGFLAGTHLGGTLVDADKPIAVTIYDDSIGPTPPAPDNRDIIGDQIVPTDKLGSEFIIIRGALSFLGSFETDFYYIFPSQDNTIIKINGVVVGTYNKGEVYTGLLTSNNAYITTSNPAYVYQLTGNGGEMTSTNLPNINCTGSQFVSFTRSTSEDFQLNLLCKANQINSFVINGQAGIINGSLFDDVPGTNGVWKAARINTINLPQINSIIFADAPTVVSNTTGLFHLGFLNGTANTGSRLGYFSNFSIGSLAPFITGKLCVGNDLQITANKIEDAIYTWKGPAGYSVNPSNDASINILNAQTASNGRYFITATIPTCGQYQDSIDLKINPLPIATINPSEAICYGTGKTMQISSTGTAPWNFTYFDGNINQTATNIGSLPFTFPANNTQTKTYQVLSVSDATGCASTGNNSQPLATSTISINPLPTAKMSGTDSICENSTGNLQFALTGKAPWDITYFDQANNQTINGVTNGNYLLNVSPSNSTKYVLNTLKDGNGCINNNVDSFFVKVNPLPIANFDISSEVCLKTPTIIADASNVATGNITQWNWNMGDGNVYSQPKFNHTYTLPGSYTVNLVVTSSSSCKSLPISKPTLVNQLPIAAFNTSAIVFCEKQPIQIQDQSNNNGLPIVNWYWRMGDGNAFTFTNNNVFSHTYNNFNNYTIQLIAENSKGCFSDTLKKNIAIYPVPVPGFITPEICLADGIAQFKDTSFSANGNKNFTYQWNFNAGTPGITPSPTPLTATVMNPTVSFASTGIYQVSQIITSDKGCIAQSIQPFTVNGSIPKASFDILTPKNICSNTKVSIKNTSTVDFGNITKIEILWDAVGLPTTKQIDNNPFPGKVYDTIYKSFQQPPLSKDYTIRLLAYSGGICVNTYEQIVTVHALPKINFTTIPGICNDTIPRLVTQATETSGIAGTFTFTGTGISVNGLFTPKLVTAGTYNIQATYTSNFGCIDTASQNITVWPSPIAKWSVNNINCEKNNNQFSSNATSSFGNITSWNWNYGDGTTANYNNGNTFSKVYPQNGSYQVSLQVVTDSGCRSTYETKNLVINPLPKVSFTMPNVVCLPDGKATFNSTSTIIDGSENMFAYRWTFGDPNDPSTSLLQQPTHQYSAASPANGYPVKLIIVSKNRCTDSLIQNFKNVYPQPIAQFNKSPSSICLNESATFTDQSNGLSSSVTSWNWNLGGSTISTIQNPSKQFVDSGTFNITLQITNGQGCKSNVAQQPFTVHPLPHLKLGGNIYVLEGGSMGIKPQNNGQAYYFGNNLSFLWSSKQQPDYLDNHTAIVPVATLPSNIDSIIYKLVLTGIGGCSVTDSIQLVVLRKPIVPNAFSPNGDGYNPTWHIQYIESYPDAIVEVYNRYGQMVYYKVGYNNANGWDGTFQGKPLPVGTYYYIIDPKNGRQKLSGSVTIIR